MESKSFSAIPEPAPLRVSKSRFKAQALELFRQIEASATDPLSQLRGSVLHYDNPFAPVAEGEWEALA